MTRDGPLRVAALPLLSDSPYQRLLHDALEAHGVGTVHATRPTLAWARRAPIDVLHLHWLEYLTGSNDRRRGNAGLMAARAARLLAVLLLLRLRGVGIVWTVHNLLPHDTRHPRFDRAIGRLVARLADEVITHSRYADAGVRWTYRPGGSVVAYHGNFVGFYPRSPDSREETRHRLGLPDSAHVFLAFGLIREYKQLPELVRAFRVLPHDDVRLLVVGRPRPEALAARLREEAGGDPRILLRMDHVPDDEVAALHAAADFAVLPYRDVFSSGALLLALSEALPVIAPASSTATELAQPPAVIPYDPGRLSEALAASLAVEPLRAREAAAVAAQRYPWSRTAEATKASYRARRPPASAS